MFMCGFIFHSRQYLAVRQGFIRAYRSADKERLEEEIEIDYQQFVYRPWEVVRGRGFVSV